MTWSRLAQRLRLPLGFLFAVLYVWLARPTVPRLLVGGAVALAGVLIRAWAAGHIVKKDRLTISGPYAHTRNPLYLGSFLIGAGFAIAASWSLILVVIVFWVFVYGPVMERERVEIGGRFPDAYPDFERNVPAFLPRPLPWRPASAESDSFSWERYVRQREWQAALAYVAVMTWLSLRTWLRF